MKGNDGQPTAETARQVLCGQQIPFATPPTFRTKKDLRTAESIVYTVE
jgi:hypothetical protein